MRIEREPHGGDGLRDRPLGDLVGELFGEAQGLVREEVRLAKAELRAEAKKAARGAAGLGAGGAMLLVALILLGVTLVLVGATFLPAWVSALLVTAAYAAVGWGLVAQGKKELERTDPSRAVDSVKEDARWAKETMRDVRSSRSANA